MERGGAMEGPNAVMTRDLEYAARYWLTHAAHGILNEDMVSILQAFDSDHVMAWLSMLSVMGCSADAIHAVKGTILWLKVSFYVICSVRIFEGAFLVGRTNRVILVT
jgi:hypothetical protein